MNILNLLLFRPDVFLSLLCINVVVVAVAVAVAVVVVGVTTYRSKYSQTDLFGISLIPS